jgi:hypothetical protein
MVLANRKFSLDGALGSVAAVVGTPAVGGGRLAEPGTEDGTEILLPPEAASKGDCRDRNIGTQKQLLSALEAHADDFVMDGVTEQGTEPALKRAARDGKLAANVVDTETLAGVLAYESDRLGDLTIAEGENVAGLAGDDSRRGHENRDSGGGVAGPKADEQRGGLVADALMIGNDAREGRVGDGRGSDLTQAAR